MAPPIELTDYYIIQQWKEAFLSLNKARLKFAQQVMSPRQYNVLSLLPILLHVNHSRLPGFVGKYAPAGITSYSPAKEHKQALQGIARGLQLPDYDIKRAFLGVYLMGSIGSIAQADDSDLDVWLCYEQSFTQTEIDLLEEKCRRIEQWAEQQGAELHIFPMNLNHLRRGQHRSMEGDDCGSSQNLLLLDEFYRSAVYLAGAIPRWWVIPRQYESVADEYWQALLDANRVQPKHWLDMGEIATIPEDEFIGAGLWQLHKGLSKPYKSLLKLALTHHYSSQHPQIEPLCWDLKKQLHGEASDPIDNDAYLLLLNRLESHDDKYLPLIRRAFYFKLDIAISHCHPRQDRDWRSTTLRQRLSQWGWSATYIRQLDQRQHWPPRKVVQEQQQLLGAMMGWYRDLLHFSRQNSPHLHIDADDMTQLGNRLAAAFESRPGKIMRINPNIRRPFLLPKITISQNTTSGFNGAVQSTALPGKQQSQQPWQVYLLPPHQLQQVRGDAEAGQFNGDDDTTPLVSSGSLIEVLAFIHCNQIADMDTRVALLAGRQSVGQYEIRELLRTVMSIETPAVERQSYLQAAVIRQVYIFLNIGRDAQAESHRHGLHTFSRRDDAFNYSEHRQNLLRTIDILMINSWGEWQVVRLASGDIIKQALELLFQSFSMVRARYQVFCTSRGQAAALRERFKKMLEDVILFILQPQSSRYLIQTADCFYLIERPSESSDSERVPFHIEVIADQAQLLRQLAISHPVQQHQKSWQLDRYALRNTPLRCVLDHNRTSHWQVFYWLWQQKLWIFVSDENGALVQYQQPLISRLGHSKSGRLSEPQDQQHQIYQSLKPLLQFLQGLLAKQHRCQLKQDSVQRLSLYRLEQNNGQRCFVCHEQKVPTLEVSLKDADLWGKIHKTTASGQRPSCHIVQPVHNHTTLGIGRMTFVGDATDDVYTVAVKYWLNNRLPTDQLHLRHLEISDEANLLVYLSCWQQLDQRLRLAQMRLQSA